MRSVTTRYNGQKRRRLVYTQMNRHLGRHLYRQHYRARLAALPDVYAWRERLAFLADRAEARRRPSNLD